VKKYSFFLIAALYGWLIYAATHPTLPSPDHPLIFYSNQARQDFHLTLARAIAQAHHSIDITMYTLSDEKMIQKLHQKALSGVKVTIYFDPKGGSLPLPAPITPIPLKARGLMHRKIVVIDDAHVFLGSANMTTASLMLHDNLSLGFYNPELAHFLACPTPAPFTFAGGRLFLLPHSDALPTLLETLGRAQKEIFCAMFTLTHPDLIDALIQAHRRGIKVTVALDYYTARGAGQKGTTLLKQAGVPLLVSRGVQLLHHKWALIDQTTLVLGSTNWTGAAFTRNHDCLLFLEPLSKEHQKYMEKLQHTLTLECQSSSSSGNL
jgi:phosphatidylserine/phosphatidylglycerophosphate/cardiolipin synthase-like enzyme